MDGEMNPEIRDALEALKEYGTHHTPAGRLWSAIAGALLIALGLSMLFM